MTYEYKTYSLGFEIAHRVPGEALYSGRHWGAYRRGGLLRYRNYRRNIKSGLTYGEMIGLRLLAQMNKTDRVYRNILRSHVA